MKEKQLKTSNTKGITLIALIITIIVMLILIGVTVNIAINGRLFVNANKAKTDTQNALNAENELSEGKVNIDGKIYNSMDEYLENAENQKETEKETSKGNWILSEDGNTVTDGNVTLNIGDYVNYTYDTPVDSYSLPTTITGYTENRTINQETDLKWRILGVDENKCLTLISDKPTSDTDVGLGNSIGYNNGIYILNDICEKLYSNSELGIKARSLNIKDVEGGFSNDGNTARDNYNKGNSLKIQYGKTKTYTSNLSYPVIYAKENGSGIGVTEDKATTDIKKDGIGENVSYYNETQLKTKPEGKENDTESKVLTCTQTYYYFDSTPTDYCKNEKFYNMIFGTNTYYWLASRFVDCDSNYADFGLRLVGYAYLYGFYLFYSDGDSDISNDYLRPAVSLGSNIKVSKCEGEADGSNKSYMHTLSLVK